LANATAIEPAEQAGENRESPVEDIDGILGGMESRLSGDFGGKQGGFRGDQAPSVPGGSGHGSDSVEGDGGLGPEFRREVVEDLREFGDTRVVGREVAGILVVFAAVLRGAALALDGLWAARPGAIGAGGGLSSLRYHPGHIVHRRWGEFGVLLGKCMIRLGKKGREFCHRKRSHQFCGAKRPGSGKIATAANTE
jgi:hypothetical protein